MAQQEALRARGVEVVCVPTESAGRVDLAALLRVLGDRGIASVLVEGGATLSAALLRHHLVDKVLFFVAPKIIGGDGLSVIGACGVATMEQVLRLHRLTGRALGDDFLLEAYMDYRGEDDTG
jgi:riboflavin biosynthesis pyrimidine reductase